MPPRRVPPPAIPLLARVHGRHGRWPSKRLDPAPLGFERPAEPRMAGFCHHFALLHCALLRATGTPARIRCGFAGYFEAQRWTGHWVVEY